MPELSFEQWALIADIYTPVLVVISLRLLYLSSGDPRKADIKALLATTAVVYASMLLDDYLSIWPTFNADYSTHSGIALVFVAHIVVKSAWRARMLAIGSLLAYLQLMHHQHYHTYLDMSSTLVYLLPLFWLTWRQFAPKRAD
ncbi:hypothetical protein [Vibrio ezurae]|uniref:Uncharacterized protein n=1 Tax=Vibrio ezurae NBRC 102218 TaxID=1219080 RepID=U3AGP7_9VIBR|nr:hypothetical protein [Vibrio ezurae]GAD79106.1 hypothetical protein VEZ01S_08_01420 [Vibrio ezurae NBRC 102218]